VVETEDVRGDQGRDEAIDARERLLLPAVGTGGISCEPK